MAVHKKDAVTNLAQLLEQQQLAQQQNKPVPQAVSSGGTPLAGETVIAQDGESVQLGLHTPVEKK